jgi:hypothetical protein
MGRIPAGPLLPLGRGRDSEEEEERGTTGIAVFDQLRRSERLSLLALVAKGLHDREEPCPDLTALTAGTIASVFAQLRYAW